MKQNNFKIILYIMAIWFLISFVTNIIGPLIPIIIKWYTINYALAGFLPFSFFWPMASFQFLQDFCWRGADRTATMLGAFSLNALGCLLIASSASYLAVIAGLFVIGLGMAMLQVVINPLTRSTVGEEHFAFYAVLGQLVFGVASFLSPFALSLLQTSQHAFAQFGPPWVPFYAGAGLVFACFIALTAKMRLPKAELAQDERVGSFRTYLELLGNKHVLLFFVGIVAYVGTEQGLADWMGQFLFVYHGVPAETTGAYEVSLFWGLMVIGCMLGLALLRLLDSQLILRLFGLGAVGCVLAALLGPTAGCADRFPALRFRAFGNVVDHLLAGPQLGGGAPRLFHRHFMHRHPGRSAGALGDRLAGRQYRPARGDVPDPGAACLYHFDQLLGAAPYRNETVWSRKASENA